MWKEKICVPPPPPTLRGLAAQKKLYAVPRNFFSKPPLLAVLHFFSYLGFCLWILFSCRTAEEGRLAPNMSI